MMAAAISAIRAQVTAEMITQQHAKTAPQRRLVTCAEAGGYLGRSEHAIRQLVYKRQLPTIRSGRNVRLDVNDLDQFIEENRV